MNIFLSRFGRFSIIIALLFTGCLSTQPQEVPTIPPTTSTTIAPKTTPITSTTLPSTIPSTTSPSTTSPLDLNEANVMDVIFRQDPEGRYTFTVTIRHNDTGWEHYADWWRIKTIDGVEIQRRILTHPHVEEQPFTRSLSRVEIPEGVEKVIVEGHDNVHGYGGATITIDLSKNKS